MSSSIDFFQIKIEIKKILMLFKIKKNLNFASSQMNYILIEQTTVLSLQLIVIINPIMTLSMSNSITSFENACK